MKKIYTLLPITAISFVLAISSASASGAELVPSIQGKALVFLSLQVDNNAGVYRDGNDEIKENNSRGTSAEDKENNSTTTKENDEMFPDFSSSTNFKINGNDERTKENRGQIISELAKVYKGDELRLFVINLVNKNKDITDVTIEEDRVSLTRNIPTKLFGFINSTSTESVSVVSWGNGTNQVTTSRPWWNFFSKGMATTNTISLDIESRLKNIPTSEFKAVLSAETKALIISEIQATFEQYRTASTTTK